MKLSKLIPAIAVLLLAGCGSIRSLEIRHYSAHLTGAGENPPVATTTVGDFTLNSRASYSLNFSDIQGANHVLSTSNLICSKTGKNGPVVYVLWSNDRGIRGQTISFSSSINDRRFITNVATPDCPVSISSLARLEEAIHQGLIYVDVRSNQHPTGEARGKVIQGATT